MLVETTKNQMVLNQMVEQKKEVYSVETDIIVNDIKPDVLKIVNTNGVVCIYKKEIIDGKLKIDGAVNVYIIYMADDEKSSIRSLNTSINFTQTLNIENSKDNMESRINILIKSFDTKIINGRKLNIKANLETNICIYANENVDIITGVDNICDAQMLQKKEVINVLVGNGTNKVMSKDTIVIDSTDDLAEIMKVNFKIVDEETKISYNKVLSKADIIVEILYLTEDNRLKSVSTRIPVMGFVDIPNINENCKCDIQNILSNLVIKPNNKEEHSIYIEAEITISCSAYESKETNIIEDLYGINNSISFDTKKVNGIIEKNKIHDVYRMNEKLRMPELTGRVFDIQINPTISKTSIRKGKISYDGNLELFVLFEHNGSVINRDVELPFNFEIINDNIKDKSKIETQLKVMRDDYIVNQGNIEVTVEITFDVLEQKSKEIDLIENLEIKDNKDLNTYSMVIYFVKPGDTLWKIAKMFRSTVEDIKNINNIEDENMIKVGQQLYIPKSCGRQVTA